MRPTYRVTPLIAWVVSLAILAGSGVLLGLGIRDTVRHVTADDQPATITEISGTAGRSGPGRQRDDRTISFRLADGTEHGASISSRWFWWPDEGDTVHVHETSPGDWEISEDFSWLRTIGVGVFLLLPWVVAILKAWEWAERTWRPERYAAKEQAARQRVRRRRASRRRSDR